MCGRYSCMFITSAGYHSVGSVRAMSALTQYWEEARSKRLYSLLHRAAYQEAITTWYIR